MPQNTKWERRRNGRKTNQKKLEQDPLEKIKEKTKKSNSLEQDPQGQHFSRPTTDETQPWVSVAG
jgi:hypothetical protein